VGPWYSSSARFSAVAPENSPACWRAWSD
jgi:hypothetical protein